MGDHESADTAPVPEKSSGMSPGLTFHYKTYSFVVLLGAPGGTFNFTGQQLFSVFGKYGKGNVIQQQGLVGIVLGDSNQLIIQPPRITFKGATEEILQELYRNARPLVLRPFESHPAAAFGINFELDIESNDIQSGQVLRKLLGETVAKWLTLRSATVERESSFYTLKSSDEQPGWLNLSINNHIDKPQVPHFDDEMLKAQIASFRKVNETTVKELYECVQKLQS